VAYESAVIDCRLQQHDFVLADEYERLRESHIEAGAVVTFTGLVRDLSQTRSNVSAMELHTYEALAKDQMRTLAEAVANRFDIQALTIIHRFGKLNARDQIVFVGVAGKHRSEAFLAAEMTMDHLKSEVAFWKKEYTSDEAQADKAESEWISVRDTDRKALERWK